MSEEELNINDRIQECVMTIKKLGADIDALRIDLKTTKDPVELARISTAIDAKTTIRFLEMETRDRMSAKRDTICYRCLVENNVFRPARTQTLESFPICMAHWKAHQKSHVKVDIKPDVVYTKVGDLAERLK